ncbi:prepilin peptidase [Prochlorococcus marinus XMU1419]|uniref:prepilin peptidase n=1 Tax=Prochlorococcus marinus TaxID=1219 RepID=UPI001ADB4D23|nr:A24 family peptidase [Prochlorococcus marinus]MBO8233585.1 prepilin peptidase [Prochlorococcus marinus XMU1419]MBW3077064.1 prepilin peptidase [Prochlorococcus marinus str. XMU1419]
MASQLNNLILIKSFLIGICFGSFFNVVIYRLPLELSIVRPRSFCPKCKSRISWRENIPLLSWLIQKGKCRNCENKISISYPIIEFLTGVFFVILNFSSQQIHSSITNEIFRNLFSWIFFSIIFLISLIDINHFWVPQKLINYGFLFGFINLILVKFIVGNSNLYDLIRAFATIIVSYLFFELIRKIAKYIFKKEALGQGDSKLISMISVWLGPVGILLSVGISYIFAAIFVIFGLSMNILRRNQFIPFAPFLAIGGLMVWFFGNDQIILSIYGKLM